MTWKIEKASDGQRTTIRLNGRLQSEHLDELKMQGNGEQSPIALDLESVILVDDLNGERFLPSPSFISIKQQGVVLWRGRLRPGESVQIPDALSVHLFIARGSADLQGTGALQTGDAVRLSATGARRLRADAITGTEVLIWETDQDLQAQ
jgi:hypothetical protein